MVSLRQAMDRLFEDTFVRPRGRALGGADITVENGVLSIAAETRSERRAQSRLPYHAQLVAFRGSESRLVQLDARDLSRSGLGAAADARLEPGERLHLALRNAAGEPALVWARVVRSDGFAFEGAPGHAAQVVEGLSAAPVSAS